VPVLAIVAGVDERLAGYLTFLSVAANCESARLAAGQFHDVVLAGDNAYRFPRDEDSLRRLPAAVALLSALAEAGLPAAIPVPVGTAQLDGPLGECHVPLRRLPGRPLGQVRGRQAERAVVGHLANLLDRLFELGSQPSIANLISRVGPDYWHGFADQVRSVLYPLMSARGRERADAELTAVTSVTVVGDALVHTDLGGDNLLWVSAAGVPRLAGILDWDQAHIGDQAADLASIGATIGWRLTRQIDSRRRGGRPLFRDAMIIAATFALQQALPAALNGDTANLDDGLHQYR
jgi:hypothetical protein